MTHTPGPWVYEDEYIRSHYTTSPRGNSVALPLWMEGVDDEAEWRANAHLIAAAPELLEALEGLLDQCTAPQSRVDAAETAVAKARGES